MSALADSGGGRADRPLAIDRFFSRRAARGVARRGTRRTSAVGKKKACTRSNSFHANPRTNRGGGGEKAKTNRLIERGGAAGGRGVRAKGPRGARVSQALLRRDGNVLAGLR